MFERILLVIKDHFDICRYFPVRPCWGGSQTPRACKILRGLEITKLINEMYCGKFQDICIFGEEILVFTGMTVFLETDGLFFHDLFRMVGTKQRL